MKQARKRPHEAGAVLSWQASERHGFYRIGKLGARLAARRLRPMVGVRVG